VSLTLTVQTQNVDPKTRQLQTETKALLNVSPRNVFDAWLLGGGAVTTRLQPVRQRPFLHRAAVGPDHADGELLQPGVRIGVGDSRDGAGTAHGRDRHVGVAGIRDPGDNDRLRPVRPVVVDDVRREAGVEGGRRGDQQAVVVEVLEFLDFSLG